MSRTGAAESREREPSSVNPIHVILILGLAICAAFSLIDPSKDVPLAKHVGKRMNTPHYDIRKLKVQVIIH